MGLFEDVSKFLEDRLDEFLENNPHLELQAIEEQLREQEYDTKKLITDLQLKQKNLQDKILSLAEEIKVWHLRVKKAQAAGRNDLANAASEREALLLRQGNQLWGQMEGVKKRIAQSQDLLHQIQKKRQEVKIKLQNTPVNSSNNSQSTNFYSNTWQTNSNYSGINQGLDSLEAQFQAWETDNELEELKKNMGL